MSKSVSKQSNRNKVRFPYIIIIPSDQQPDTLHTHTLTLLHAYRVPSSSILLAVPSSEQEELYKARIPSEHYGQIVSIHAPLPSADFYNRISDLLPEGIPLVYMSDNLTGLYEKEPFVTSPLSHLKQFTGLLKRAFQECQKAHAQAWGIYPIANGHFMNHTVSTRLKYIPGCFWGCFNPGSAAIRLRTNHLVDYERSILYWKVFGSLVRLNWVACTTTQAVQIGSNRPVKQFAKLYSEYVTLEKAEDGSLHIRLHNP